MENETLKQEIPEQKLTDDLNIGIGTKETTALKPGIVSVMMVEIETLGKKNSNKL